MILKKEGARYPTRKTLVRALAAEIDRPAGRPR